MPAERLGVLGAKTSDWPKLLRCQGGSEGLDCVADTEGTELDVLRGFTGDARAFVIEANDPARASALIDDMAHRGFQPARSLGVNVIFAKPGRDFDVLAAAHVTGTTEITAHPMGALATVDGMVGKGARPATR